MRLFIFLLLSSFSLVGMDTQKEYLEYAASCDSTRIHSIPRETITNNAHELFEATLKCPNARELWTVFDQTIRNGNPKGNQSFAHYVNRKYSGTNYFFEKLIERKKY